MLYSIFVDYFREAYSPEMLIHHFSELPLVIKVSLISISISVIVIVYIQLRIILSRMKGFFRQKRIKRIAPKIDQLILDCVVLKDLMSLYDSKSVENAELDISLFKERFFNHKKNRQIVIDRLLLYRQEFGGVMGLLLRKLYLELSLDKMSLKKIKKFSWEEKVKGITELEKMDISIDDALILPLTNSRISELRTKARSAYIKVSKNDPFKFFDVTTEPLLKWDQIELFNIITTSMDIAIPDFARWVVYSENKTVISFCLKLIAHFKQYEGGYAVMNILKKKDSELRRDAIECLGKLQYAEAESLLIHMYNSQPLSCQIEILKTLGAIGTQKGIDFIKQKFLHSLEFDLQKNAANLLVNTLNHNQLENLLVVASPKQQLIIRHFMNPLL